MPLPSNPELLCGKWLILVFWSIPLPVNKGLSRSPRLPFLSHVSLSLPNQGKFQLLFCFLPFLHGILTDSFIWYLVLQTIAKKLFTLSRQRSDCIFYFTQEFFMQGSRSFNFMIWQNHPEGRCVISTIRLCSAYKLCPRWVNPPPPQSEP